MPGKDVDEWCFRFRCADQALGIDDFMAYLPEQESEHENLRTRLAEFISQIRTLDNLVQTSCESEHHSSGIGASNFKLHIGWIKVADQVITVRYWGTVVNTEWEAVFARSKDGSWANQQISVTDTGRLLRRGQT